MITVGLEVRKADQRVRVVVVRYLQAEVVHLKADQRARRIWQLEVRSGGSIKLIKSLNNKRVSQRAVLKVFHRNEPNENDHIKI